MITAFRTEKGHECLLRTAVRVFKAESQAAARIYEDTQQLAEVPFTG